MTELSEWIDRLEAALMAIDDFSVGTIIYDAQAAMTPLDIAEKVIPPALHRLGVGWQEGTVSLSQVYLGGRMCEKALDLLLPIAHQDRKSQPKIAIAVLEDYHNLGQKIVLSVLRASGYEVINYDRQDIPSLLMMAERDRVEVLLISTLMYRSALRVKKLVEEMNRSSYDPMLVVGGAPFNFDRELWREVGADEVGKDASDALSIVEKYLEGRR